MVTCPEVHPERALACVRHEEGHTWHRAEEPATWNATHCWTWGRPADPPDAPPRPDR